jgi:phospholipid/cholesterol/gamma-HCH transport system substrate-binding protein
MQKQPPTPRKLLAMAGFALSCFGLLLFMWLAFGGSVPLKPHGYRFHTSFGEATQLAKEADVRISGVSVGKVKTIHADTRTGRTAATIELDSAHAPLPRDTRAILRQKTLLGETYVELTPGTPAAGMVPEGGTLPDGQVSRTVELDEILRTLDAPTRASLQQWLQTLAVGVDGRGRDISDALGRLAPFEQQTEALLRILDAQHGSVRGLVRDTGTVAGALSARDGQLRDLIRSTGRVVATTAGRDAELRAAVAALPRFEGEASRTVTRLARFARHANPLVTQLRPSARELSPTLRDVAGLSPDLKALFGDLDALTAASRRGLPALERFLDDLHPVLAALDSPLAQLNPILGFVGAYRDEAAAFLANTTAATEATDVGPGGAGRLHYLRSTAPLNPEALAQYGARIPSNRTNPYAQPGAFRRLAQGLLSYETRHCGRGTEPTLAPNPPADVLAPAVAEGLRAIAFGGAQGVRSPACTAQAPFSTGGRITRFPQVVASSPAGAR